jgi:hypothetical protein
MIHLYPSTYKLVATVWTHQLLVYAADVNLLGDNINTIKKNIEALTDTSMEDGPGVNAEKTVYVDVSSPEFRT